MALPGLTIWDLREEEDKSSRAEDAGDTEGIFALAGGGRAWDAHFFLPLRIGYTDYGYKAALMRDARLRIN